MAQVVFSYVGKPVTWRAKKNGDVTPVDLDTPVNSPNQKGHEHKNQFLLLLISIPMSIFNC